jgi:hypothetical protein
VGARLEIVGSGAVFLGGDGSEVWAVLEASLDGEGGDVVDAGRREIGLLAQGRVDVLELVDVAHGVCGARTPPSPAAAALASRVALGRNGRGVCNGSGTTLF